MDTRKFSFCIHFFLPEDMFGSIVFSTFLDLPFLSVSFNAGVTQEKLKGLKPHPILG